MTRNRPIGAWIRPLAALTAVLGMFILGGCGGGSGAPNNPYAPIPTAPAPLSILPPSATVYPGTPATLTISGGTAPYRAFSSNPAILPVAANVTGNQVVLVANPTEADVAAAITIQDAAGQSVPVTVTVRPAPLFSGLTVAASAPECGSANICSGATGTASVTAKGVAGAPLAGRQIRFDVVYGPFAIQSTNPATPLVQTLTVVTDINGAARVGLQADVNATTQPAQIRATDLTTGQPVIGNFTVVNNTSTAAITIVPAKATITSFYKDECSSGFQVDYFIYGGNPPYRVSSTFPAAVNLFPTTVNASGGHFSAVTNGTCVNPLTFTVVDAAGKQTTALLENLPGTEDRPTDAGGRPRDPAQHRRCDRLRGVEGVPVRHHRRHAELRHQHQHARARWSSPVVGVALGRHRSDQRPQRPRLDDGRRRRPEQAAEDGERDHQLQLTRLHRSTRRRRPRGAVVVSGERCRDPRVRRERRRGRPARRRRRSPPSPAPRAG